MNAFIDLLVLQLLSTSLWEWTAVSLALAYVILAVKESLWCWPAAFISTGIYAVLFFDVNLYMESLLNLYYLVMAVYGWYQWRKVSVGETCRAIIVWSLKRHLLLIASTCLLVMISGLALERFTDQDFAYVDSFTTWFAIVTTYMVTQKVLENWLYWIVINSVSIYLFLQKGFAPTALLFVCYLIIAVFGWFRWRQHYRSQGKVNSAAGLPRQTRDIKDEPAEPGYESA